MNKQIQKAFTYHPPKADQPERYNKIRNAAKSFAELIDTHSPDSQEKVLALIKLEETVMWANAAIARNE